MTTARHHSARLGVDACSDGHLWVGPSNGRPANKDPIETLSDFDLEAELTIAAYAPGRMRWKRYQGLLGERQRRRLTGGYA